MPQMNISRTDCYGIMIYGGTMLLDIDFHNGIPIYRQVIDQVRQQILTGELAAGEQLETVRDLAARIKVNPMTVSKAYSQLESEGMLERRRGVGLFIAEIRKTDSEKIKNELFINMANKTAMLAAQMGIEPDEAVKIFRECLANLK